MKAEYWVSCKRITVWVQIDTQSGRILQTAPVVRKFIGQPLSNLTKWFCSIGGFQVERLGIHETS